MWAARTLAFAVTALSLCVDRSVALPAESFELSTNYTDYNPEHHALLKRAGARFSPGDIANCGWPRNVPVIGNHLPVDALGHQSREPTPSMWWYLNMDLWLSEIFSACPPLTDPVLLQHFTWPVLMGKYMVADGHRSNFMTLEQSTWTAVGRDERFRNRGPITRPGQLPDMHNPPTAEEILEYRRWYAMQSMVQMNLHYTATVATVRDAVTFQILRLPQLTQLLFGSRLPAPAPGGFNYGLFLSITRTIVAFVPYGNTVLGFVDSASAVGNLVRGDVKAAMNNFKSASSQAAYWLDEKSKKWSTLLKNGVYETAGLLDSRGRPVPGAVNNFKDFADLSTAFGEMAQNINRVLTKNWQNALQGDPRAPAGFLWEVSHGTHASMDARPLSQGPQRVANMQHHLERQLIQYMLRSSQMFIFRHTFNTNGNFQNPFGNCMLHRSWSARHPHGTRLPTYTYWPNQMCTAFGTQNPSTLYMLMPGDRQIGGPHNAQFHLLNDATLRRLNMGDTQTMYEASEACFNANNQEWYSGRASLPRTWTFMQAGSDVRFAARPINESNPPLCTWALPVWDNQKPRNRQVCNGGGNCPSFEGQRTDGIVQRNRFGPGLNTALSWLYTRQPAPSLTGP